MKPFAVVTGASKGIGKAIAEELAKRQYNLLLIARSEAELSNLAALWEKKYHIIAFYFPLDLSRPDAIAVLSNYLTERKLDISILVNNAGYGLYGNFSSLDLKVQLDMLQVNVLCLIQLTYLLLPELRKHPQSYILNIASTAAYQALPSLALYAASKSFVLSFSRSLKFEERNGPVSVTCVSPGPVHTNFINRAGIQSAKAISTADKIAMDPEVLAVAAVKAMFSRKTEVIPGLLNKISAFSSRILPKKLLEQLAFNIYN